MDQSIGLAAKIQDLESSNIAVETVMTLSQHEEQVLPLENQVEQQLVETNFELKTKLLDKKSPSTYSDCITDFPHHLKDLEASVEKLQIENEHQAKQLTQKQEEFDKSANQLSEFSTLIKQLQKEKHKKNKHLMEKAVLIDQLQAKCEHKDKQLLKLNEELKANANTIEELQAKFNDKNEQLVELDNLISKLQFENDAKTMQMQAQVKIIGKQKYENLKVVNQMNAVLSRLEQIGANIHDDKKLIGVLEECVQECCKQNQYAEAIVHCESAINLEKVTRNRSHIMGDFFSLKAFCHLRLMEFREAIGESTSALQFNSECTWAIKLRAEAYFESKLYFHARRDLKKALELGSECKDAHELLKQVQKCIDELS